MDQLQKSDPLGAKQAIQEGTRQAWAIFGLWIASIAIADIAVRGKALFSQPTLGVPFYLVAESFSAILWLVWFRILYEVSVKRRWLAAALAGLAAPLASLSIVGVLGFAEIAKTELTPAFVEITLRNPKLALSLVRSVAGWGTLVALVAVAAAVILVQRQLIRRPLPPPNRVALAVFVLATAVVIADFYGSRRPPPCDLLGLRTLVVAAINRTTNSHVLPVPEREAVASVSPVAAPDVLLVVHESVSTRDWRPWNPSAGPGGEIVDFLARHQGHAVHFPACRSAGSATCIALPAMLSGLDPDASTRDYARTPLLWNWARAAGYRTALFSAQEFEAFLFPTFFLGSDRPDLVRVAADFGTERVNAEGVDEKQMVEETARFFEARPRSEPRLAVVQFNSTHVPCWAPDLTGTRTRTERCERAAAYMSGLTVELLDRLEHAGTLEHTLVIVTSDHGEDTRGLSAIKATVRPDSMSESILSVPLLVHLPAQFPAERLAALRTASAHPVSSRDILPTVLDVWGLWPPRGHELPLPGRSLIEPIGERAIVATNFGEISDWSPARFAIYGGRFKWLVSERAGMALYDVERDPAEAEDLSAHPPAEALELLKREVEQRSALRPLARPQGPR